MGRESLAGWLCLAAAGCVGAIPHREQPASGYAYGSTAPLRVRVDWPGAKFAWAECSSPYDENTVRAALPGAVSVEPGEIVTLTNVPLGGAGRRKK